MDIKIDYEDWIHFRDYLPFARNNFEDWVQFRDYLPCAKNNFYEELSAILFDLHKEETTFEDIVETVKIYKKDFDENGSIDFVEMYCRQISAIDPVFFQEYYKENHSVALSDYQKQANFGAICYCEEFINELYEKMEKDGLFFGETKDN